jgi:hypothetical protein
MNNLTMNLVIEFACAFCHVFSFFQGFLLPLDPVLVLPSVPGVVALLGAVMDSLLPIPDLSLRVPLQLLYIWN